MMVEEMAATVAAVEVVEEGKRVSVWVTAGPSPASLPLPPGLSTTHENMSNKT